MILKFPTLQTERLLLRPLEASDLDFVFDHFSSPDVHRFLVDEEPVTRRQQAQEIVDFYTGSGANSFNRWVIVLKEKSRPIGTCGYHQWDTNHKRAEIGYDLEMASRRQRFMTEALSKVIDFGLRTMELNRIEAMVHHENEASIRLLEGLGFQKEGFLREHYLQSGKFHDHWLLALLRSDFLS